MHLSKHINVLCFLDYIAWISLNDSQNSLDACICCSKTNPDHCKLTQPKHGAVHEFGLQTVNLLEIKAHINSITTISVLIPHENLWKFNGSCLNSETQQVTSSQCTDRNSDQQGVEHPTFNGPCLTLIHRQEALIPRGMTQLISLTWPINFSYSTHIIAIYLAKNTSCMFFIDEPNLRW